MNLKTNRKHVGIFSLLHCWRRFEMLSMPKTQPNKMHSERHKKIKVMPAEYLSKSSKNQKPQLVEKMTPRAKKRRITMKTNSSCLILLSTGNISSRKCIL